MTNIEIYTEFVHHSNYIYVVEVDFNQSLYYAKEEEGVVIIELTISRQTFQPFEVIIMVIDVTTTGMQLFLFVYC